MREDSKNNHLLVEKSKIFPQILPSALGSTFSTKFVFDAKIQGSGFEIYQIYVFARAQLL